jgi:hypothetical protein
MTTDSGVLTFLWRSLVLRSELINRRVVFAEVFGEKERRLRIWNYFG